MKGVLDGAIALAHGGQEGFDFVSQRCGVQIGSEDGGTGQDGLDGRRQSLLLG